MRRLALIAVLILSIPAPARANPDVRGGEGGNIEFRDERPGDDQHEEPGNEGARPERHYYRVVLWHESAGFCIGVRSTTDAAYAARQNAISFELRFDRETGAPRQNCPPRAITPPQASQIAADVWRHVEDLPRPTLATTPAYAVTGKDLYLEIHGPTTWSRTIDNPIGDDVVITAHGDYVVDWDDPTWPTDTVTTSQGGPWPDGDVTHVYTHTTPPNEHRAITVTQRWTATWRTSSGTGTLDRLTTQSDPLPIEVREIQSVRRR